MTLLHEMAYVYEVYRQRSFTRAAQALYISQPSLSQMIRKAEGRIGTTIFDRSTSPIGLTEAGRAYIRAAEQVLQIESDLRRYLDDAERCITGVLTLGGAMLFTSYVLPPLLSTFSERYPGVELRLHEAPTARLKEQLQEGTLDFAVDNSAFDPAVYEARLFKREQVILAVPRAFAVNEAAARFRLSAADLLREETPRAPLSLFQAGRAPVRPGGFFPENPASAGPAARSLYPRGLRIGRGLYQRYAGRERSAGRAAVLLPHRQPGRGAQHQPVL